MKLQQISESCFAVLNERSRMCDPNSGLVNRGCRAVIDTQADLPHARRMIELLKQIGPGMPMQVINTSEDCGHVSGNQLFADAEIIAHRSVPEHMQQDTDSFQRDIALTLPTTLFDDGYVLELDGVEVRLIHVGPCRHAGDTIVHVPREGVVFAGDTVYRQCTPMGWTGSYEKWLLCLDLIVWLDPEVIVPGHGPVCGIDGAMEMKAYLEYVHDESMWCLGRGMDALEAAKQIGFGPYREWRYPARLLANVESAYREICNEPAGLRIDAASTLKAINEVAKVRGVESEC